MVCSAQAADSPPSADTIIERMIDRAQQSLGSQTQTAYSYTKVTVYEELDGRGKVKGRKEKTYQVMFKDGASTVKLLQVNGHAPEAADLKQQAENEAKARQLLAKSKSDPVNPHANLFTPELAARFQYELAGTTTIDGRSAWKIAFRPASPELPEKRIVDRLLNRISGSVWIDTEDYEIAHAEIYLGSEVNLLGGVIASLKRLEFSLNRSRIADGVWCNTSSTGEFEGRKLIDAMRIKTRSRSTDFHLLDS